LIPEVQADDLIPTYGGVRAQALMNNSIVDVLIVKSQHAIYVCNAPSPAARSWLEIGKAIARQIPE